MEAEVAKAAAARSARVGRLVNSQAQEVAPEPSVEEEIARDSDSALLRVSTSVWDDPEEHLFGTESRQVAPPSSLLTSFSEAEPIELFATPSPERRPDTLASPEETPEPEPKIRSPAANPVNMRSLIRLAWMWLETGYGAETVWVRRLVTLDDNGSVCIFASDKAPRPDILVRREDCAVRRPRTRRTDYPHAFRIDSSEHRTDGVYAYKLILSPCKNPEEEAAMWVSAISIDRSRCNDDEADTRRKTEHGWKSDAARGTCTGCEATFSILRRRHHCRLCGDIFCDPCSEIRRNMPLYGYNTPQRVCRHCAMQQEQAALVQTQLLVGGRLLGCGSFEAAMEAFDIGSKSVSDSTDDRLMDLAAGLHAASAAKALQDDSRAFAAEKETESKQLYEMRDYGGAIAALEEALARRELLNSPTHEARLEELLNTAIAAKLAHEKALRNATEALAHGSTLLDTTRQVEEGIDVLSSEYVWQDYSQAVAVLRAGLTEDTGDESLRQRLALALQEAETEASHVSARQKLMKGNGLLEKKDFAGCFREFEAGVAIEIALQSDGTRTPLEAELTKQLTLAKLEQRRGKAQAVATAADDRIQQGNYVQAVELLGTAMTLEIEDPELSAQLEELLTTAQSRTTSIVEEKIALSERMLKISAWDDARHALAAANHLFPALKTAHTEQAAAAQQLGEKLRDALKYAEAASHKEQGEKHMREKNFESAAAAFKDGLDREQQRDQALNECLKSSLDKAVAAKCEQDSARERAKSLLEEGEALAHDDDTLEAAVAAFESGLALRAAINGGTGYTLGVPNPMEDCMHRLEQGLQTCTAQIVSRDAARKAAKERLVEGSLLLDSPNPRMSTVIQKFEEGLQQKDHKNEDVLNEQLTAALEEAKNRASKATSKASDYLSRGKEMISLRKFAEAIEIFQHGLDLRTEAAGASSIMEQLALCIGDAERGIAMREKSRESAERLLEEGTNLVVAKDYDMAVACFQDGLLEQTDDADLTYELEQSLAIANEAIQERLRVREESRQLEKKGDEQVAQKEWCSAIEQYRESLAVADNAADPHHSAQLQRKIDATLMSQKSALEAAQRYLKEGKALCIGGQHFAEAKIAFEKGLAEKPSDPELVQSLLAAVAQLTSTNDEGEESEGDGNGDGPAARAQASVADSAQCS